MNFQGSVATLLTINDIFRRLSAPVTYFVISFKFLN